MSYQPSALGKTSSGNRRLKDLLQQRDNRTCADCGAPDPKWAAILSPMGYIMWRFSLSGQNGLVCIALTADPYWPLNQLDIKNAFLNDFPQELCMDLPPSVMVQEEA